MLGNVRMLYVYHVAGSLFCVIVPVAATCNAPLASLYNNHNLARQKNTWLLYYVVVWFTLIKRWSEAESFTIKVNHSLEIALFAYNFWSFCLTFDLK